MTIATIRVDVDDEGRVYPWGSDEPLLRGAIKDVEFGRSELKQGDIVVEASGRAWTIEPRTVEEFAMKILMAVAVDANGEIKYISDLEGPMIRIYHCGEPRHDLFS